MNKELIEKLAEKTCATQYGRNRIKMGIPLYLDAVWHDSEKEVPEYGRVALAETREYGVHIIGPCMEVEGYRLVRKDMGITRWAYVSDLLPDNK